MTTVTAHITHDRIRFSATGHAGGDVCCAISMLCYTLVSALDDMAESRLRPGDTWIECDATHDNRKAFEIFERGFRLLEDGYPDRVKVDICV